MKNKSINKSLNNKRNLTMLMDYYEMTMGNEYFVNGLKDTIVYFDNFFRKVPDKGGFVISAGLQQLIEYIEGMRFTDEDIAYLRCKNTFNEGFLEYLRSFKFTGDIWAVPEGMPVFPNEPIITVRAPIIEAQLVETMILTTINHQSLIATKANRIVRTAKGKPVYEFGSRRAQGYDGAVYGARASIIGGCSGTACTMAGAMFDIPVVGTMAHSNVQLMSSEYEAFKMYARTYPDNCSLLVDTYNVLKSGIPNSIKVWNEEVVTKGYRPKGIRLDSGDLAYLSKKSREMLDEAGYSDAKIGVSNSLNEYVIRDLLIQDAKIDWFGVGENLITAKSDPVFGGVYKLVAVEEDGKIKPRIKISENIEKITNPSYKKVWRLYDKDTNKSIADVLTLHNENISNDSEYELFDEKDSWKRKVVNNFYAMEIQEKIFENGELIYNSPSVMEIQEFCKEQIDTLWDELLRLENPHKYYVDLSLKLWNVKNQLIKEHTFKGDDYDEE
ncbi:MAG: putative nicotinate phosphoribosyltransferase [Clostridiaceae bacterium]|jgi:nicotinate phosphoribosyltransferase|nr:putative nicotinate phosphoribosyltransferase [Clostridiaceae bacterium]